VEHKKKGMGELHSKKQTKNTQPTKKNKITMVIIRRKQKLNKWRRGGQKGERVGGVQRKGGAAGEGALGKKRRRRIGQLVHTKRANHKKCLRGPP